MVFSRTLASGAVGSVSSSSASGSLLPSEAAIIRSSSASSNCWISRSIFSDDLPKPSFFSLAMRSRGDWIN
jgi:hypothetical protein